MGGVPRPTSSSNASSLSAASTGSREECVFGLTTLDEAKSLLMGILHLLVIVSGSVLRLPMFDEYGFVAHYPLSLFGSLPLRECTVLHFFFLLLKWI